MPEKHTQNIELNSSFQTRAARRPSVTSRGRWRSPTTRPCGTDGIVRRWAARRRCTRWPRRNPRHTACRPRSRPHPSKRHRPRRRPAYGTNGPNATGCPAAGWRWTTRCRTTGRAGPISRHRTTTTTGWPRKTLPPPPGRRRCRRWISTVWTANRPRRPPTNGDNFISRGVYHFCVQS